jgi:phospholipid/cholesterol/gamma-HCH transport system substrate-binding protein
MKIYFTREVKIGIMVIAGLAVLFFGVNYLKGINIFTPSNYFYAKYENIDGLTKSAPVKIKGYKVGQVHDIIYNFNDKYPFTVVVSLNDDLKLPKGSRLELFNDGIFGSKNAEIVLAQNSNQFYQPGDTLQSSSRSGIVDNIQETVLPEVKNIIPEIDSLLVAVRILAENKALKSSLSSLEVSAKNLEQTSADLKNIMRNDVPAILGNVNTMTSNLSITSSNLSKVDFVKTVAQIDSTVSNIKSISAKINNENGTLGLLMNDKSLYTNLTNATNNANLLMIDLKANPSRYVHFSIFEKSEKK